MGAKFFNIFKWVGCHGLSPVDVFEIDFFSISI